MTAGLALFALLAAAPGAPLPATRLVLRPGRPVGLAVLDPGIAVFYPARAAGAPMRYRDYVALALVDAAPGEGGAPRRVEGYASFLEASGVPAAGVRAFLDAPLGASRDAVPARGRLPVVLIAPGNGGAVQDEAALAELLAGSGYVVAVSSSPGWRGRRMTSDADVLPVAEAQAADLLRALDGVRALPYADASRWALVGYSFGARAALLVAARRPGARALVSLAGGIGSAEAKDWLPAGFDRASVAVPILHVYDDADRAVPPDFTLLRSLPRSSLVLSKVPGLGHFDLITYGLASARLPALGSPDPAQGARIQAVADAVLGFLAAKLR